MHGFGGMQKERGAAGRSESRGDLARDEAALSHAGNYDASGAAIQQFYSAVEVRSHRPGEAIRQGTQRLRFNANYIFPDIFHQRLCGAAGSG